MGSSLLLGVLLPSQILTHKKNMVQLTGSEFQTTTHTKSNNMGQLTDLEFQTTTTKKVTARDTITQDATGEEPTGEEELASGEDAEDATEEVTPRGAESSTVKEVKLQERTECE